MEAIYPYLVFLIRTRGMRKSTIAKELGITTRALNNKLQGKSKFSWEEACLIQNTFFPDIPKEQLLAHKSPI